MRTVLSRLALRLVLALTVLVAISRSIFGYLEIKNRERIVIGEKITAADELSRSITAATWHAMLADNRSSAYEIMATIAEEHGVENIHLFNKEGLIAYSTADDAATRVDVSHGICETCHGQGQTLIHPDLKSRTRILRDPKRGRSLEMVTPILNEKACSDASCHSHDAKQSVLGVLDLRLSLANLDHDLAAMNKRAREITVLEILLISIFILYFTRRFVGLPVRRLNAGTREIAALKLERDIPVGFPDELGDLAKSFNTMRVHLKDTLEELQALTQSLESQVVERTQELHATQEKLIRSDRLASLGQLAASVAHEINNPVSGVLNFSMVLQRMIESGEIPPGEIENFRRYLRLISEETMRVGRIVSDLLAFSRTPSPQGALMDLNELVGHVLTLLSHRLELEQVAVITELAPTLPQLSGDSSQIQQVLINLLMNAAEACSGGGEIHVRTRLSEDGINAILELEDNGQGIAPENLSRIFDPFFSTKEEGKGVGLGLSVVYGIVEAHGGTIDVHSKAGAGTTFRVILPIHHESPKTPAALPSDSSAGATDSSAGATGSCSGATGSCSGAADPGNEAPHSVPRAGC